MEEPTTSVADTPPPTQEQTETVLETFREMIADLVSTRELLWQMTLRDLRIRYKQALMGFAWALLMPIFVVAAGFIVRYAFSRSAGEAEGIGASVFAGVAVKSLCWTFVAGAFNFATQSMTGSKQLLTKIYFPREVFPFSCVLTQVVDSLVASSMMAILVFGFLDVPIRASVLWAIPLLGLLFLFVTGGALILSFGNLFFRDVKYIVQVGLTFGIFATPVFLEPVSFGPTGSRLLLLNPLAPILEGMRLSIVEGHSLLVGVIDPSGALVWSPLLLAYSAIWSIGLFLGGWYVFHKLEFVYAEFA